MKIRQRILALLTAVALGTCGAVALAAPAHAASYGPYFLVHKISGLCVEVPNFSTAPLEQTRLTNCADSSNQFFWFTDAGDDWLYSIRPYYNSTFCLEPGNADLYNSTIVQWPCNGAFKEVWRLTFPNGKGVIDRQFQNTASTLCMSVGISFVGAYVVQRNCYNGTIWYLQLA